MVKQKTSRILKGKSNKHDVIVVIMTITYMVAIETAAQTCPAVVLETSVRGKFLQGFEYKFIFTEMFPACILACKKDPSCFSLNYNGAARNCSFNSQTNFSAPHRFVVDYSYIYDTVIFGRDPTPVKGLKASPAISCSHVFNVGSGLYWLDPEQAGTPALSLCDMDTDGGGWTNVCQSTLSGKSIPPREYIGDLTTSLSTHSKKGRNFAIVSSVLRKYSLTTNFTQIRFRCRKQSVGRTIDLATINNAAGRDAVRYFSDDAYAKSTAPVACGSFQALPDDNSVVSKNCEGWVPPLFVIEFLHRAVDIFQDYFNECTETSIKEHIVVVYEVP
ncbi:predicted protein [Nematostella vectensis]|uniref:Fibrinogen C-terminal domain-containing protein n=1 Tax=Nematostella vectensis TaxID=45351 RepID=A7SKH5_NEMVE|nr:predicted protein [Nematostella vectensis]|eukprot:XP_001627856.1 predicted protein [Nematostella vectensis]